MRSSPDFRRLKYNETRIGHASSASTQGPHLQDFMHVSASSALRQPKLAFFGASLDAFLLAKG